MSQQQQQQQQPTAAIYTIHESQLNNNNNNNASSSSNFNQRLADQQAAAAADILIDTSSTSQPPMTQQQAAYLLQQQQQQSGQPLAPVTRQPGAQQQAPASSARVAPENQAVVYSVHPVFGMLENHSALLVRQKAQASATCCGLESANTYTVRAHDGSPILKAVESSNCCERCCFEGNREYSLELQHEGELVARLRKPFRVSRFCCYSNAATLESPQDNPVGFIRQLCTLFGHPRYAIYDCQASPKKPTFILESTSCKYCFTPLLSGCLCANHQFRILTTESRQEVGTISSEPDHLCTLDQPAAAAAADSQEAAREQLFGIQFADSLEPRHKLLLLAACFMMDFFYFENERRRRKLASC